MAKKLDRPSLALMREVARTFAEGHPPAETPQDEARATAAPAPDDDLLVLRWSWPAERIVRRVRAASPWPGALAQIGETEIVLTRAAETRDFPRTLLPGEAAVVRGRAVVRAADHAVELVEGRLEGDQEPVMGAEAIARLVEEASEKAN